MSILRELAEKHGTDKAEHGYCEIYEPLLGHLRDEPIKLLELGVWKGASVHMWDDYFTNADSDLCFIDKDITRVEAKTSLSERVRLYRSDQTEWPLALRGWVPDIIIDDASHHSGKTISTFITFWPALRPGGLYIVEDTAASYHPDYGGAYPDRAPAWTDQNPYGRTTMQFFQKLTDRVNAWAYPAEHSPAGAYDVSSVTFHPDLIVVRKK